MKHYNIFWVFWLGVFLLVIITSTGLIYVPLLPLGEDEVVADYSEGAKHGEIKSYNKQGKLHTLINYNHGIKEGKSYIYYSSGQIMLEMTYKKGKREGASKKYYQNGAMYAYTPYINDKLTGLRKTYYYSGQLKSQVPYHNNEPCLGLKEFTKDGDPKPLSIFDEEVFYDKTGDRYLILSISNVKDAQFYVGKLAVGDWLDFAPGMVSALPHKDGHFYYKTTPDQDSVNIICMCKTKSGSPFLSQRTIELK